MKSALKNSLTVLASSSTRLSVLACNALPSVATILILLLLPGCEADDNAGPNNMQGGTNTASTTSLTYGGLPGLQDQLFTPTCANSGCHDSTFEPDFRTLGSTYATLVNQSIIKNDAARSFSFRVVPGLPDSSQLLARLTYDIDDNSGIMPLAIEPESRYEAQKDTLIAFVQRWIEEGAKRTEG